MVNSALTDEDIYIGKFLIEISVAVDEFKDTYGEDPVSVAVDSNHYGMIKTCCFDGWVNRETMVLNNGIKIVEEKEFVGSFMSMRRKSYRKQ